MKREDPDVEFVRMEYDMIHNSNEGQFHFIHGFYHDMELKLGVELPEVTLADSVQFPAFAHVARRDQ